MTTMTLDARQKTWLKTTEMAADLGLHRGTLLRLIQQGFMKLNVHYRLLNPTSARPTFVWHLERTRKRMNAHPR